MSNSFRISRCIELSLIKYLETCFAQDWSSVSVSKTFQNVYTKTVTLPIVVANLEETQIVRQEIGSNTLDVSYMVSINIWATSDGQRLDLSDYIKDKIKDGWTHYDFSKESGDTKTLVADDNGRDIVVDFISDIKVDFGADADEKDKYRHLISIKVRHGQ